ncbi:uncharacterized protein [Dermacentor albipictus]|uniref:uncharacterized protein n=1 Tax=Dermacentor albipictus TaxID=60249 RepID=UPI0031FC33BC
METTNSGSAFQSSEVFLTAQSGLPEAMTMMTMNVSSMYSEQKTGEHTSIFEEALKGQKPGNFVMATVLRIALVGVLIYQSKAVRQCVCLSIPFLLLLLVWLLIWLAMPKAEKMTTTTASAETSIVAFDTTTKSDDEKRGGQTTKSEAANETALLDGFDALSLLSDMTVPNHVLDIDSFPE